MTNRPELQGTLFDYTEYNPYYPGTGVLPANDNPDPVVVAPKTSTETGRLGELLTAYKLEKAGYEAVFVDRRGVDFWVKAPSGQIINLEVKTATAPSHDGKGKFSYSYQLRDRTCPWYAFVALDVERVILKPKAFLKPYVTNRIDPSVFNPMVESENLALFGDWAASFDKVAV